MMALRTSARAMPVLIGCGLLLASSGGAAQAAILMATYTGISAAGTTLNSNPIPAGTPLEVQVLLSTDFSSSIDQGRREFGVYVTAIVNSTSYQAPDYYRLELMDPSNTVFPGAYVPALMRDLTSLDYLVPGYMGASPAITVDALGPTVFTGYVTSLNTTLPITTAAGDSLFLDFDANAGVEFSISAIPEPSTLALLGLASLGCLWRRRGPV